MKRDAPLGLAAVHGAIEAATSPAALLHVRRELVPIKTAAHREKNLIAAKGSRHGIQVVPVIETGLLNEVLILGIFGSLRSGEHRQDTGFAHRLYIGIDQRAVLV